MPDIPIPLHVEIGRKIGYRFWNGSEAAFPMRDVIQDDAESLFAILSNVPAGEKDARMLRNMKRQLRPIMQSYETADQCERKQAGVLVVSEEGLRFIHELKTKPPEIQTQTGRVKMSYTGTLQEFWADFEEFYERRPDLKSSPKPCPNPDQKPDTDGECSTENNNREAT